MGLGFGAVLYGTPSPPLDVKRVRTKPKHACILCKTEYICRDITNGFCVFAYHLPTGDAICNRCLYGPTTTKPF